jgi:predicted NBD/HSP70 family sugar kinase
MQKNSTMRRTVNKIFKGHQLTIGVDLGDRWSFYCVLDESGKVILEEKLATTPGAMKQTFAGTAKSHGHGDRNAFPLGEPAVNSVRTRSNRGARTKS